MLQIFRPTPPIHWDWLTLRGPDAADYLHRLTTAHVRAMQPGEGSPGFFLNAQGKVRAYFDLWRISGEEFFVEFDSGAGSHWKKNLQEVIEQFHFGEKFSIEAAPESKPDLVCAWVFGNEAEGLAPRRQTREIEPGLRAFNHGDLDFGSTWITSWGTRTQIEAWIRTLGGELIGFEQVERMRIARARPRVDAELATDLNPLEAGLFDAISENKGCYPGQEVIEKIVSLGSPARRLVRIDGKGTIPVSGEPICALEEAATEVGKITSAIGTEHGFQALGFVRKTHARNGMAVRISPESEGRIALVTDYKKPADEIS